MRWIDRTASIEALEDCSFDAGLVAQMESLAGMPRPLAVSLPSFLAHDGDDLPVCNRGLFPTFSVTGPACALMCAHCRAEVLKPMIPATSPEALETRVRAMAEKGELRGFLLSGGSNRRNEIAYARFWPAVARLKRDLPGIAVAVHTGLVDDNAARAMAAAGIDLAMIDMIGDDSTISEVYNLDRPVAAFAASLDALCAAGLKVAPHIVIGLHFGALLGERSALSLCLAHPIAALVLVVAMPIHAERGRFVTPDPHEAGRLFLEARVAAGDVPVSLGCARPPGLTRRMLDAYAVMAGLDAVAHPSEGAIPLARALGRPVRGDGRCCAVGIAA